MVANIKGYVRKRSIVTAIKKGKVDSLPAEAFADSVTEDDKEAIAERGLAFLGGEDLPDPQRPPQTHRPTDAMPVMMNGERAQVTL